METLKKQIYQANAELVSARQRGDVHAVDTISEKLAVLHSDLAAARTGGVMPFQNRINAMY